MARAPRCSSDAPSAVLLAPACDRFARTASSAGARDAAGARDPAAERSNHMYASIAESSKLTPALTCALIADLVPSNVWLTLANALSYAWLRPATDAWAPLAAVMLASISRSAEQTTMIKLS